MLIELKNGGIVKIETNMDSYDGCETCDYGRQYINYFTVHFVNSPPLHIEVSQMYDFLLSTDFLMKLFLQNLDEIKLMTEGECLEYIINTIEKECLLKRNINETELTIK